MRQWTVDAFAAEPFKGNPACVVAPFDTWPAEAWMQRLAAENNQAETAFLLRNSDDPASFGLRWFTPTTEVPLCGHATLASAHVLFAELSLSAEAVTFHTRSGPLVVGRRDGLYEMDFPASPPRRIETPPELVKALGVTPTEVWAAQFLIAILKDEAAVRALDPDIAALKTISTLATEVRGNVGVAAPGSGDYDVVSRFFAPGSGIPEDAATGSWHCLLSPLYADKLGTPTLRFHQAYPGRGADLECEHRGDRVLLRGAACTVMETVLRLTPA